MCIIGLQGYIFEPTNNCEIEKTRTEPWNNRFYQLPEGDVESSFSFELTKNLTFGKYRISHKDNMQLNARIKYSLSKNRVRRPLFVTVALQLRFVAVLIPIFFCSYDLSYNPISYRLYDILITFYN